MAPALSRKLQGGLVNSTTCISTGGKLPKQSYNPTSYTGHMNTVAEPGIGNWDTSFDGIPMHEAGDLGKQHGSSLYVDWVST